MYSSTSKNLELEYVNITSELLNKTNNPKLGLERIKYLLKAINFNKGQRKIVQIIGTNGKGSTAAFVESILCENRYTVGTFISPHLHCMTERIRINRYPVEKMEFIKAAKAVLSKKTLLSNEPSFFEYILAIALNVFEKKAVDVIILEAGLGGRLDATSACSVDVLGITKIDYDHQHILGHSIKEIAHEKIMAAKKNQTVLLSPQIKEVKDVINAAQKKIGFNLKNSLKTNKPLGLLGDHQKYNAALSLKIIDELKLKISKKNIDAGLKNVKWPARLEYLSINNTSLILDAAHNPSGLSNLFKYLQSNKSMILVYGSLNGPNVLNKIEVIKKYECLFKKIILHSPKNPRAMAVSHLKDAFLKRGFLQSRLEQFDNIEQLLKNAARDNLNILICGSLYSIGEIRAGLLHLKEDTHKPSY